MTKEKTVKPLQGKLQALSIQTYALFDKKEILHRFEVKDSKKRLALDVLQGKMVSVEQIKKILG